MNLAELRETLLKWLSDIKVWGEWTDQSWGDYVAVHGDCAGGDARESLDCVLYTNDHQYRIGVHLCGDSPAYLGASVFARKPRAGEDWNRGNDLPDGSFTRETFDKIMFAIVGYELVAKVKNKKDPAGFEPAVETGKTVDRQDG